MRYTILFGIYFLSFLLAVFIGLLFMDFNCPNDLNENSSANIFSQDKQVKYVFYRSGFYSFAVLLCDDDVHELVKYVRETLPKNTISLQSQKNRIGLYYLTILYSSGEVEYISLYSDSDKNKFYYIYAGNIYENLQLRQLLIPYDKTGYVYFENETGKQVLGLLANNPSLYCIKSKGELLWLTNIRDKSWLINPKIVELIELSRGVNLSSAGAKPPETGVKNLESPSPPPIELYRFPVDRNLPGLSGGGLSGGVNLSSTGARPPETGVKNLGSTSPPPFRPENGGPTTEDSTSP